MFPRKNLVDRRGLLKLAAACTIGALFLAGCTRTSAPPDASSTPTPDAGSAAQLDYHPAPGTPYRVLRSPDSRWQASASEDENETQITTVQDLQTGSSRTYARALPISFSPDNRRFILAQSAPGMYGGLFLVTLGSSDMPRPLTNVGLADNDPATANATPYPFPADSRWDGDLFIFSVEGLGHYSLNVVTGALQHEK